MESFARRRGDERGFTLVEALFAVTIGLVLVTAALSYGVNIWGAVEGSRLRDDTFRSARFVGVSLERDFQATGVGIYSTEEFGSLTVWADTLAIFHVPFDPVDSPPYPLYPPSGTDNPLPAGGTCGTYCVEVEKVAGQFDLAAGDLARLQIGDERRLILVEGVTIGSTTAQVTFSADTVLLNYPAGLSGGLLLDRYSTIVQRLQPIVYYLDGTTLRRADHLETDGTVDGDPIAQGVTSFEASLLFLDGDTADVADPLDTDNTNDYEDLAGALIRTRMAADHAHKDVNDGAAFAREFEWRFTPRNLMYERNR